MPRVRESGEIGYLCKPVKCAINDFVAHAMTRDRRRTDSERCSEGYLRDS